MRITALWLLFLAATLIIFSAGCGKSTLTSRIEGGIEARLPEIIGPARSYKVEVSGNTSRMVKGRVAQVRIHGEGVGITDDLTVDELHVTLDDVTFDRRAQSIKSCAATNFKALVYEPTLNDYLRNERPDLDDLRVRLRQNRMLVHVRPTVLRISFGVDLEGDLRIVDSDKVHFKVDRLALAGLKMPGLIAGYVEERINPVQDLSVAGFDAKIKRVRIIPGTLLMEGTADLGSGDSFP